MDTKEQPKERTLRYYFVKSAYIACFLHMGLFFTIPNDWFSRHYILGIGGLLVSLMFLILRQTKQTLASEQEGGQPSASFVYRLGMGAWGFIGIAYLTGVMQ